MIDTIKFLVPIDDIRLLQKIKTTFTQIKKSDLKTGKIDYEFYTSSVNLGSHNRNVSIRISDTKPIGIFIEFSVPKYEKGNNIEMTHPSDLNKILEKFYKEACSHIEYTLPHFSTWQIYRLDICYNWIFKNTTEAEAVMSFIQRIDYPRKKKSTYNTSVMYVGTAYTIKFYLKGAEFRKNDFKKIKDDEAIKLLPWADRMVRFEIGFKKRYLKDVFGYEPLLAEHIQEDEQIEWLLSYYLNDKVFCYVTPKNTTEAQIVEKLESVFSKTKSTRLFQFHKDFNLESGTTRSLILSGGLNRSTIYRNKKDLKKADVGFDISNSLKSGLIEQLVIPSGNSKFDLVDFPKEDTTVRGKEEVV